MERKLVFWVLVGLMIAAASLVTTDLLSTYVISIQSQGSDNEESIDQLLFQLEEAYAKTVSNFYQPTRAQQKALIAGAIRGANLVANGKEVRDWASQVAFEAYQAEQSEQAGDGGDSAVELPEMLKPDQPNEIELVLVESYMNGESFDQFIERFRAAIENARATMSADEFLQIRPVVNGAIRSMIASLQDQYSRYNTREEYDQFTGDLNGEYQGIGAYIGTRSDGRIIIISPIKDGPAENAGVRAGDLILFIDALDTKGFSQDEAARNLRGSAGTVVVVEVEHADGQRETIEIVRDRIRIPSVEYAMVDERVGKVSINRFGRDTPREVKEALAELESIAENELSGLIIDLRGNGGGYLQAAKEIGSLFVDGGNLLIERGRDSERVHSSYGNNRENLPIAILIDEGTASASEILAGAIRDNQMGILIGRTTFGKGVVQTPFFLSDGSAVILTTSEWYTAGDHPVDSIGLMPEPGYRVAGWQESWGALSSSFTNLRQSLPESLMDSDSATAAVYHELSDALNISFREARDDQYEASLLVVDDLIEIVNTEPRTLLDQTGIALQPSEAEQFETAFEGFAADVDMKLSEYAYRLENNDIKAALEFLNSPHVAGKLCPCEFASATSSEN